VTLYLDVLFIENLVINFFLLKAVTVLLRLQCKNIRLLVGAFVGGIYVVAMVLWPDRIFFRFSSKVLLSVVIVIISFQPQSIKTFLKTLVVFLMSTFVLAGILVALDSTYTGVQIGNVLVAFLLLVMIFLLLREWIMKKYKNCEYHIRIWYSQQNITIPGIVDTGNFLMEPMTHTPVIIVEMKALELFLPEDMISIIKTGQWTEQKEERPVEDWQLRIRYIPYNTLDQKCQVMTGFAPDYVDIWGGDLPEVRKKAVIGFSKNRLSKGNAFKALINPTLME